MQLELDSLGCVKMLINSGLETNEAEAIVLMLTAINIKNLHDKAEIDAMLSESVQNVILECRREFDKRLEQSDVQFDKRLEQNDKRIEAEIAEARSRHRWLLGSIFTCTLALAGYLSALIRLTH